MAQKVVGYIKLQIPAGKATPAPPVGRKPAWWEGTECGYGVFRANHERISTRPIERHREIAEALFR